MMPRLAQYLFAFTVLGMACAVYQSTFAVWVEPGSLPEIAMAASPAIRKDDGLNSLFAPDAWQRGNCKRLKTRDFTLLFENWEQISGDQWKLWPVSVVLGTDSKSPLVLDAAEGAEIKFTESLDVMSGGAPPIERGRMIGSVRIHNQHFADAQSSPRTQVPPSAQTNPTSGSQASQKRRINIEASDVGIDHRKIWTTQPIRAQLGDVKLVGRDLTLHLSTTGGIVTGGDNALAMLDRLELIYLDELTIPLTDGGLWDASDVAKPQQPRQVPGRPMPLGRERIADSPPSSGLATVHCRGRVTYQFATGELALVDHVEVRHQASVNLATIDTFRCDELRMRFADLLAKRKRGEELPDYLLSMVALGRPARATLPSFDVDLAAGQIELDTRAGLVRMGGPAGVLVSYAGNRWQFGQVNYMLHPTDPKLLGTFEAIGKGRMDVAKKLDVPVTELQWTSGVKLERTGANEEFTLTMDGDVAAAMTDGGTFRCDTARLVLQSSADGALPSSPAATLSQTSMQLIPKHFQAIGKEVRLNTPVIDIATRLLNLYFEVVPTTSNAPATSTTANSSEGLNPTETAKSDGALRRWVKQPGSEKVDTTLVANSTPVASDPPSIHGDTITAKLRLSDGSVTARDLTVVGNVSLRHEIQSQSGALPAVMSGDSLALIDGGGNDILQIGSGVDRPARFDLGDGFFVGPMIQVRMADNVVWIRDAGEFQLPTQILPQVSSVLPRGQMMPIDAQPSSNAIRQDNALPPEFSVQAASKIEWLSPPRCRWKGQMVFDGRTAVLTDGVDIHATIVAGDERDVWDMQLTGDQLQVVLDQDVKVRDVESVKSATVDHVLITGSPTNPLFVTANQLTADGTRKARHVLAAPQLTLTPKSGLLNGAGPGWYRAWMQMGAASPFTQPVANRYTTSREMANPGTALSSMFGVHLVYQKSLDANLNTKSLDFISHVRIAARHVGTWDDLIDVAQMQGLRLGESTLDCDRLRLAIDGTRAWAPIADAWQLEAMANIAFQTRNEKGLFHGTADRASYEASKDIFLIEGSPGRAAIINQTLPTGQPGISASVNRMMVNPKTMEVQNYEFQRLQLGTLPSGLTK